jgi:peptidoglycan/LPS O-acetylase OafA/YrhL
LALIIITSLILLVGAAYLVMVIYDIPVRKYLSRKRNEKLGREKAA